MWNIVLANPSALVGVDVEFEIEKLLHRLLNKEFVLKTIEINCANADTSEGATMERANYLADEALKRQPGADLALAFDFGTEETSIPFLCDLCSYDIAVAYHKHGNNPTAGRGQGIDISHEPNLTPQDKLETVTELFEEILKPLFRKCKPPKLAAPE